MIVLTAPLHNASVNAPSPPNIARSLQFQHDSFLQSRTEQPPFYDCETVVAALRSIFPAILSTTPPDRQRECFHIFHRDIGKLAGYFSVSIRVPHNGLFILILIPT